MQHDELTPDEKRELHDFRLTSLTTIQDDIKKSNTESLVGYINWLLYTALFPLTFFKYDRQIDDAADQANYRQLMKILGDVRKKYFKDKSVEPVDLVLFMCGFEPVGVEQEYGIKMTPGTPLRPMLENTTILHKEEANFKELQRWGREFLGILSAFGPFNAYLTQIYNDRHSGSQPYIVALRLSVGEHYNFKFENMILSLFITAGEREKLDFIKDDNSMYMTKLKTGRVMKLLGLPDETVTSILSSFSGGRRTSRRKQTKSRNPRKRKSTKQRRGKSMKYRKS